MLSALVVTQLRSRRRALLFLGFLVAVASAVPMFCATGARLSAAAPDRYLEASHLPDVVMYNLPPEVTAQQLVAVSGVQGAERLTLYALLPSGIVTSEFFPMVGRRDRRGVDPYLTEPVISGRRPDPAQPLEVALGLATADRLGVAVGDVLTFDSVTPAAMPTFSESSAPDGPVVRLTVVGLVRQARDLGANAGDLALTMLTPAFVDQYGDRVGTIGEAAALSLRVGAAPKDVDAGLNALVPGAYVDNLLTQGQVRSDLRPLIRVVVSGLLALALAVALAGVVVVGQAMVRIAALDETDDQALRAMGLAPNERLLRIAIPFVLAGAVGLVAGGFAAVVASPWLPLGLAQRLDPQRGGHADLVVLFGGTASGLLLVVVFAWLAARLSTRSRPVLAPTPSALAGWAARLAAPPEVVTGLLLTQRRGGRGSTSSRTAVSAGAAAVLGVLAAVTFGASLSHLAATPRLYGWGWDAIVEPTGNSDIPNGALPIDEVMADPEITGVELVTSAVPVMAGGHSLGATIIEDRKGHLGRTVLRGRDLGADDEMVVGTSTLRLIGARIGDTVQLDHAGVGASFRIVGVVVFPAAVDGGSTGEGVAVLASGGRRLGLERCGGEECSDELRISAVDSQALQGVVDRYDRPPSADRLGIRVRVATPPSEVVRLRQVDRIPWILAGFLSILAAVSVGHAIIFAVRRRTREFGVLRALGFDSRQLRRVVGTQVLTLAVTASVIGAVGGVVVGRLSWGLLVRSIGLPDEPSAPLAAVLAVPLLVVGIAEVASVLPRRAATRLTAARALRTE